MNGALIYTESGTEARTDTRDADCPECESDATAVDEVRGELLCEDCGCVIGNGRIDTGPEWTAFDENDRAQKSRVGAPLTETMHDRGLTTTIDWQNTDAHGQQLSATKRSQLRRLRTWQERIRTNDATERNLRLALAEIDRMASALGIPDPLRERAAVLYRRAQRAELVRGRSIEGAATGALYVACRQEQLPRSLDEFDEVARVDRTEIGRTYRYLAAELDLDLRPVDPQRFLPRFCSELGLGEGLRRRAAEVLDAAAEAGLCSGKSPPGLAAAAIYTAAVLENEECTQEAVAEVARVTVVTVRNRYQEQLDVVDPNHRARN
jgi:transcription initiation factor TFIIB